MRQGTRIATRRTTLALLLCLAASALPLPARAQSGSAGDDPFANLGTSAGARPGGAAQSAGTSTPTGALITQAKTLWLDASSLSSSALEDSTPSSVDRLRQALAKFQALIDILENKLGLRTKGAAPFYAVPQGVEMADLLWRAYIGAGQTCEAIYQRSKTGGAADTTAAAGAVQYYWQAAATSFFQMDQSRWSQKLFPELFVAPAQTRLTGSMQSASTSLFNFLISMTGKDFSEAKSQTERVRGGLIIALRQEITAAYKELDTPPDGYLTDIKERLDAKGLSNLRYHRKQEAANQIVEAHYKMAQEYLTTARASATDEDFLLALQQFQAAAVQIYWARTKMFRLSEQQTRTLIKALISKWAGQQGLVDQLVKDTGLPADQVQAALDNLSQELTKFVQIPSSGGAIPPSGAAPTPNPSPSASPAVLEDLLQMAANGDTRSFARRAKQLGLIKDENDQRIPELIAKLKDLLYRDTVPYGYWVAVTGTPEVATQAFFQVLEERFKISVKPLASAIAVQNMIKALRTQDYLSGRGEVGQADADYQQAADLLDAADMAIAKKDSATAVQDFTKAGALLDQVAAMPPDQLKKAQATYYINGFSELRARLYLREAQMYYEKARMSEAGSTAYRENYLLAIQGFMKAADPYPMRSVEQVRADYFKKAAGDTRLPGPLVDNPDTTGSPSIHTDEFATYASRKLNSVLEELTIGSDPTFQQQVQSIVKELLAFRSSNGISGDASNPNLNLADQFKVQVSRSFGDRGVILSDTDLAEISRALMAILYDTSIDDSMRRARLAERVGVAWQQAAGGSVVEDIAATMEDKVTSVLASDESIPQAERDAKVQLDNLVRDWDKRLTKATPSADALNALFFRIGNTYREKASMLDGLATAKEKAGDADGAKLMRKQASESTLNALRFYYMATISVYYGNDKALAIQLPEWDMTLYLAYRAERVVASDAPAITGALGSIFKEFLTAPKGSRLTFLATKVKSIGPLIVQGTKAMLADATGAPLTFVAKGIKAAGRGIAGTAKTPAGKLLSLGGLALFVIARYAHQVDLQGNRLIVLDDTSTAQAAQHAFTDVLGNRVLKPTAPKAP